MGNAAKKIIENNDSPDDNLETFGLLWLDANVDTSEENRQAQKQLRHIINHLKIFDNQNLCQQYILSVSSQNRLILIVSGRLGQEIVPHIHHLRQISSIYVYCRDKETNEKWAKHFPKVTL
jgi:plasmid stabilization system protein ParE